MSSKFLLRGKITKPILPVFVTKELPNSLFLIDPYEHFLICLYITVYTLSIDPSVFFKKRVLPPRD